MAGTCEVSVGVVIEHDGEYHCIDLPTRQEAWQCESIASGWWWYSLCCIHAIAKVSPIIPLGCGAAIVAACCASRQFAGALI